MKAQTADQIRAYVQKAYIEPARRLGKSGVTVVAGEVLKGLRFSTSRAPAVCSALKTKKFLSENQVVLEHAEGPPRMQSVTVAYTYRFLGRNTKSKRDPSLAAFLRMRGIAKDLFKSLGGGEAFIRRERRHFYGPTEDS